jgi:hypothetical protein
MASKPHDSERLKIAERQSRREATRKPEDGAKQAQHLHDADVEEVEPRQPVPVQVVAAPEDGAGRRETLVN